MTSETTASERQRLSAAPDDVLRALPAMGRVMVVASAPGVLHERIGTVTRVDADGGLCTLAGDGHDCTIDVARVAAVVVDRSGRMRDKGLPKLEFVDADGAALFTVVGMAGVEPFDAGLAPLSSGAVDEPARVTPAERPAPGDLDGDPGLLELERVQADGQPVTIELAVPGLTQRWHGSIDQVRPMMGNANIILGDFHLHLRAGAVGDWRAEAGDARIALAPAGTPLGLSLRRHG